jgi:thiamine-phosphate pyrophosphorylase
MLRYVITDRSRFGGDLAAMLQRLLDLAPSVDYIQLRERDLSAVELENFTRELIAACGHLPKAPRILVNHRADVALACAAGVHLRSGAGELGPAQIRDLYARVNLPTPVVSISCHTLEEVRRAREAAVDLILFGPVFEKLILGEKTLDGGGLELLRVACEIAAPVPVLALGGVTESRLPSCLEAGAAGVAAIRLFLQQ